MPRLTVELPVSLRELERAFSTHAPAVVEEGDAYTFVVFPDTQYAAANYPHVFLRMTDWVAANADAYNIVAVLHVGDITDNNTVPQWQTAHTALSLLNDVVPYVLTVGNHDMMHERIGDSSLHFRGRTGINTFFPAEAARRYSNLAGTMVPERIENAYYLFDVAGDRYVVIALEFGPPDEALAWANSVVEQFPDHRIILLTHSYTARTGGFSASAANYALAQNPETTVNTGRGIWDRFVGLQKNAFMVLSGHVSPDVPTVPYRIGRGSAGQPLYELLFDYQNQSNGGNGWFGLLTFRPDKTLEVRLYSPYLDEWGRYSDANGFTSQLEFDLERGTARRIF